MNSSGGFNPEHEADRILAAIVESTDDAIIGKDLDGIIVTWNRGAERLYGYTADEVRGRSIRVIVPDELGPEIDDLLSRIRNGERVQQHETERCTRDGRRVLVSLTISPIADRTGRIVGAATVARDITARKRAEGALRASEQRWRTIIETAVDGIVVIDARGAIEAFNGAAERLFGYTEAEVIGQNVNILMPSPYREEHDGYLASYLRTGVHKIIGTGREVTGRRSDGTTFPLHLSVGEMLLNGERKFTGIVHDLSARVRMEERLREQAALASLGEMAAVIAHEVKNPLAGIRGAIQVIGTRLPHGGRESAVAQEIVSRIDGLNSLIKDLLLFARPPQPRHARVDIAALVTTTAGLLAQDPAAQRVRVEVTGAAAPVVADPELLKIAFQNLLVNGAHAMHGEGVIRVSVSEHDARCAILFRDSGPGIPPDIRDRIFTPFFTTKSRGTGLGLPTAKRLIEAHAGTIAIDCPAGGGTTVIVQLPAAAS